MEDVKTVRKDMVPRAGVEPARPYGQWILSPQRLPFRHPGKLSTKSPVSHTLRILSVGYISRKWPDDVNIVSFVASEFYHPCWLFSQPLED